MCELERDEYGVAGMNIRGIEMKSTGRNDMKPRHGNRRLLAGCLLASLLGLALLPRFAAAAYDTWEGSGPIIGGTPSMSIHALATSADGMTVYAGSGSGKVLAYVFAPVPVNGTCGSANGVGVSSAPTSNLCAPGGGTASAVSGSGPWNWTCAGANGGTNAACMAVVYVPPPPPPPPPTLPGGGGDLTLVAGGNVIVSSEGCGSTLTITGSGRTHIAIGGGTLVVQTSGTTRFTVVCAPDGSQALRIDDGAFTVDGGQQPLLIAGGVVFSGHGGDNSVTARYVGGKLRSIAVTAGAILLPANGFAATSGMLYAGEVAEFDSNERVTARYLGSADGKAGQVGDRLPTLSSALSIPAGVPVLTALPERQRTQGIGDRLDQQLSQVLQSSGLSVVGQDTQGVIRLVANDTSLYAALPLGRVLVAEGEASGISFSADGTARVVVNSFAFQLVPAVADPGKLANAAAALVPGMVASIGSEGEWRFTDRNGGVIVLRPGWALTLSTSNGGATIRTDASGNFFFAHDSLFGSTLYPALADRARLLAAARQLDPAATLTSVAGGETVLTLSGKRYVLTPAPVLVDVPAAHASDPFWLEGGKLYLPVGNGKAQGFGVR